MNVSRCPHCRAKLGNYLYADACPHCHHGLERNTRPLISAPPNTLQREMDWPIRWFLRVARLVES